MYSFDFVFGELDEQIYNTIWGILQVLGILLGGCLTVKNWWELLTGDAGVGFLGVFTEVFHSHTLI